MPTCSASCDLQRGPLKASVEVQYMALLNEALGGRASVKKVIGDIVLEEANGLLALSFSLFFNCVAMKQTGSLCHVLLSCTVPLGPSNHKLRPLKS